MEAGSDPVLGHTKLENGKDPNLLGEDPSGIPELWRRTADGAGIERAFKFKSFQAAWVGPCDLVILLLVCVCLSDAQAKWRSPTSGRVEQTSASQEYWIIPPHVPWSGQKHG